MPSLRLELFVAAQVERCFDLALDVDQHMASTAATGERAIAGVTSGRMHLGDTVTWKARHFGVWLRLTSQITRYERPRMFQDEQVRGPFAVFEHRHEFTAVPGGTAIVDSVYFRSPLGQLGWVADALVLRRYMRRLLERRNAYLKSVAEHADL